MLGPLVSVLAAAARTGALPAPAMWPDSTTDAAALSDSDGLVLAATSCLARLARAGAVFTRVFSLHAGPETLAALLRWCARDFELRFIWWLINNLPAANWHRKRDMPLPSF